MQRMAKEQLYGGAQNGGRLACAAWSNHIYMLRDVARDGKRRGQACKFKCGSRLL